MFLNGHVQFDRLNVVDLVERIKVFLLASTCINEVTLLSEHLGNLATDSGARTGDQYGLLLVFTTIRKNTTADSREHKQHESKTAQSDN